MIGDKRSRSLMSLRVNTKKEKESAGRMEFDIMVKLVIKDWDSIRRETIANVEKKIPQKEDKIIYVESIDAARKLMTNERMRLLRTVKKQKPDSIYSLAKMLGKNFKTVSVDTNMLRDIGVIKFEYHQVGLRNLIRPVVGASKIQVEWSV